MTTRRFEAESLVRFAKKVSFPAILAIPLIGGAVAASWSSAETAQAEVEPAGAAPITAIDSGSEPPAADHVLMTLVDRPDFILTPHVAWASREAIQALADQTIDNIEAFRAGSPRNVVG